MAKSNINNKTVSESFVAIVKRTITFTTAYLEGPDSGMAMRLLFTK